MRTKEDNMVNRKNTLVIMGCSLLVMMLASCSGMFHRTFEEDVPRSELKRMGFSLDHYRPSEVLLTEDDKAKIQKLLGHPLKYYPKGLGYYREIRHGEIGDIVPIRFQTPYGRLVILVRIRWDSIDKIIAAQDVAKAGEPLVNDLFLSQFLGRTATSSYKVVKTPQDLLAAPNPIRPITGEPAISQEIADRLQEIMAIHAVDNF
jgi:hypothetical protein